MIKLKKKFGQHLLISSGILSEIAKRVKIKEGEILLEIGPGLGHLTRELLKYPLQKLYLLEIDKEMIAFLRENLKDERVIFLEGDATSFDYSTLKISSFKLVGNLPYNVASLIVENIVLHHSYIPFALLMVQKEVAEKWIKGGSWLSIFIKTFYDIKYLMTIPPRFFRPPPKVNSALLEFTQNVKAEISNLALYKKFLTHLFEGKRKMLRKKFPENLLAKIGIESQKRVDELSFNEIITLFLEWLDYSERESFGD
ncbi:MAG: 16S rRNA (adenine(1518)-N(6)/adenine(1519)-N(6))-dimethyltransferase RsmA [Caldimicrobium sp.]